VAPFANQIGLAPVGPRSQVPSKQLSPSVAIRRRNARGWYGLEKFKILK